MSRVQVLKLKLQATGQRLKAEGPRPQAPGPRPQAPGPGSAPLLTQAPSIPGVRHDVLSSFSLVSNIHKLCTMDATPRGMEALNGVRVLSMAWVILGHTYVMLLFYGSE